MSLLEIKNLSIDFKSRENELFQAVKSVNLKLEEGEVLGIVGESGSGKTVTALSILGLLPNGKTNISPNSSINFNNQELMRLSDEKFQKIRGQDIAFIFQEPMSSLNPLHKIGKQIEETLILHQKLTAADRHKKVLELLHTVKIPQPEQKINSYPYELSGGQRQRVMIAMAIANNPKILIADEPTTALDVTIQEQIIDLLLELKKKINMSIIFISHNLRLVHKISDNIAVMKQGKIVEYGTADNIFNNPQNAYTKRLVSSNISLNNKDILFNSKILETQGITVQFPLKKNIWGRVTNSLVAVNHASFSLYEGQTLGIVGESGSGKTTLAKAIVNLVKFDGKILFNNNDINKNNKQKNKDIQFVFQDPYNSLNPRMTIKDIIGEGLNVHYKFLSASEKAELINNIIRDVEMDTNILTKYPHEFSGGQRQRIALARALILRPKIVILDEPTSALDVTIQSQILKLLKKLQNKYKLSYIFISHDMNAVKSISHYVIVMQNGKIVEQGKTKDIFEHPSHVYTQRLIRASII